MDGWMDGCRSAGVEKEEETDSGFNLFGTVDWYGFYIYLFILVLRYIMS
jgi:hypothetical protein